jgi:hypothetical protein
VISAAFDFCYSKGIYAAIEDHQRASIRANDSLSTGLSGPSPASNSFAQKIMKKGVKKFNKLTKSIYGAGG